jgi:hypothetical protein
MNNEFSYFFLGAFAGVALLLIIAAAVADRD